MLDTWSNANSNDFYALLCPAMEWQLHHQWLWLVYAAVMLERGCGSVMLMDKTRWCYANFMLTEQELHLRKVSGKEFLPNNQNHMHNADFTCSGTDSIQHQQCLPRRIAMQDS